ncbi:hypothetical protein JCM10212_005422 [Sporobolomyces blumeae]
MARAPPASSASSGETHLTPPTAYSTLAPSPAPDSPPRGVVAADLSSERTPLLSPRPSYRQRALSRASGNPLPLASDAAANGSASGGDDEEDRMAEIARGQQLRRRRVKVALGAILALILVAGIVLAIVLPLTIGRRGRGGGQGDDSGRKDTPDFTRLPAPKPGLRNPNYLVSGWHGAVASEEERCSEIGVGVLRDNGTAVDAAIATALCVGVVNSFSSGIGGGGFMVIRPPSTSVVGLSPSDTATSPYAAVSETCKHALSIDFRETAPTGSTPDMFTPGARPDDGAWDAARASKVGGLAIGVPGEIRGFEAAYKACGGGVSWQRVFQPAAELAREFKVGKELARRLNARWSGKNEGPTISEWMKDEDDWSDMFMNDGEFLQEGDVVRREAYADTLDAIAKDGADVFYKKGSRIADSMIETIRNVGGLLTADDLESYRPIVQRALEATYRGRKYYTGQYPSGGPIIQLLLNTLDGYKGYVDDGKTGLSQHRFLEALKFAFAARTEVGDPAFIDNAAKLAEITTRDYADRVRANITDDRTHPLDYYHPRFDVKETHGTTHLSVIDKYGGAVALTTTVNLLFGSRVMDKETGVILNDEMDDFATPGIPDAFGLSPSPFNYPESGKRPLSSTAPLIMDHPTSLSPLDPHGVYLAVGGSGGSRIFGAVAQVLLNLDWGYDVANSVEQSRVHHQLLPDYVSIESGYRPDLLADLESRGHNVTVFDVNVAIAEVQAVVRDRLGKFFATSDSRKNGVPAAF